MGLFGSKKMCPVCGKPASRFLPTKVEDQPLCSDCSNKVFALPEGLRDSKLESMAALREYLADFDSRQVLRDTFQETYQYQFGLFSGVVSLDAPHRLLRLDNSVNAFVLEAENIRKFQILEDRTPLFEGSREALLCYESAIPNQVRNLAPEIGRLQIEKQQYEQMERMERMMEESAKRRGETYSRRYIPSPDINQLKPFQKFYLKMEIDHPYTKGKAEYKEDAPSFTEFYSSAIEDYLRAYEKKTAELHELAVQLMAVINPDAAERQASGRTDSVARGAAAASAAPKDAVAEIQKYKSLLDSGVITDEEFTAKKRQLLGI